MKKGTEPAFPTEFDSQSRVFCGDKDQAFRIEYEKYTCGMSTRLYLAGMAMQGLMVRAIPENRDTPENNYARVQFALNMADELLRQEEETR